MRQIAGQLELEEFDDINDSHEGILTCQSYLREERPEVILSFTFTCHFSSIHLLLYCSRDLIFF